MGIRYDRDTMRRAAGPTIYFTDPTSLIMLTNEIRSTLEKGLPLYAYRRPGDMTITFGSSSKVKEGLGTAGFVIAPFLPTLPYLVIPYREGEGKKAAEEIISPFPDKSTTKDEYREELNAIREALTKNGGGKIIAARRIVEDGKVDVTATFFELCRLHPHSFVYCFHTPQTGCWIGASPELLLEGRRGTVATMALAGSRQAGSDHPWDSKNIEEQEMVAEYIEETLISNSIRIEREEPFTRQAGKVEHICTMFQGEPEKAFTPATLGSLLHDLSPTPALCGVPKELALSVINQQEKNTRGCYGGFCGPYRSAEDFTFYVNLRCAQIEEERYCIYSGGGITLKSDAEKEWDETELKATTINDSLCKY